MPEINETNKKVKSDPTGCCCCFTKSRSKKMFEDTTHSIIDQTDVASSTSIQSDTVPYSSPVSNLKPGKVIRIQGLPHPRCSRFSVDFLSSVTHKSDIVFHLNPRLNQKYIVRNSCINGRWGVEETTSIHKFSFERNKIFKLDIFCTEREFLISLNGKYICAFVYRAPLPSITTIEIRGLVEVYGVDFGEAQSYPETAPENVPIIALEGAEQTIMDKQQEMELPATRLLPDGFLPGWQLEIYGRVKLLPHSFYINLQEGYQMWPHPTVHLHLNPRFSRTTGDRLLVRNAWLDGEWGREERVPLFQFTPGSPFVMTISRMDDHFAVWVDSKLTGEFKFRRNPDKIDSVYIQGDITLMRVGLRRPTIGRSLAINGDGCICDDTVVTDTEECTCTDSNTKLSTTADCTCGDDATHTNTSTEINPNKNTKTNARDDNINRTTNTTIYSDAIDRTRRSDNTNTTVYNDADDHTRRQGDTSASVYTDAGDYTLGHSDINAAVSTDAGDHTGIHGDTSINTTTNTNTANTNTTTSNDTNNTNNPDTVNTTNTETTHTTDTTNATDVTDTTDTTNTDTTAYSDAND